MSGCSWAAAECHFDERDYTQTSQQEHSREPCNGKELRRWTTEEEWTTYIQRYSDVHRRSPSAVSIFRVPDILMRDPRKKEAYIPTRVSLGPYHHRSKGLLSMENHKPRALCTMMTRFHNARNLSLDPNNMEYYVLARKEIMQLDDSIRNVYEEKIYHEKEFLAAMLTLDGAFILEILRALAPSNDELSGASKYYEDIFEKSRIIYTGQDILQDILKLENQISFIVLRKLLDLEFNSDECVREELFFPVAALLSVFYPFDFEQDKNPAYYNICVSLIQHEQVHHLLGLLHTLVSSGLGNSAVEGGGNATSRASCSKIRKCWDQIRKCWDQDEENYTTLSGAEGEGSTVRPVACSKIRKWWADQIRKCWHQDEDNPVKRPLPRAVELRNAGIKFERRDGGITKIKFDQKSATIYLPPINITDHTEVLFRNLIAFEMCYKPSGSNYVTWYVDLMDNLIDLEEDVALLRKMGIITNGLGSDANVAELFNGLVQGVTVDPDFNDKLAKEVHAHYNNKFKVHCAELLNEHFSSPWKIVALAGAIILLLLTTVQTIFAILTLYK